MHMSQEEIDETLETTVSYAETCNLAGVGLFTNADYVEDIVKAIDSLAVFNLTLDKYKQPVYALAIHNGVFLKIQQLTVYKNEIEDNIYFNPMTEDAVERCKASIQ